MSKKPDHTEQKAQWRRWANRLRLRRNKKQVYEVDRMTPGSIPDPAPKPVVDANKNQSAIDALDSLL